MLQACPVFHCVYPRPTNIVFFIISQINEAHHTKVCAKVPKDTDYSRSSSYDHRVSVAVGEGNLGLQVFHCEVWTELTANAPPAAPPAAPLAHGVLIAFVGTPGKTLLSTPARGGLKKSALKEQCVLRGEDTGTEFEFAY